MTQIAPLGVPHKNDFNTPSSTGRCRSIKSLPGQAAERCPRTGSPTRSSSPGLTPGSLSQSVPHGTVLWSLALCVSSLPQTFGPVETPLGTKVEQIGRQGGAKPLPVQAPSLLDNRRASAALGPPAWTEVDSPCDNADAESEGSFDDEAFPHTCALDETTLRLIGGFDRTPGLINCLWHGSGHRDCCHTMGGATESQPSSGVPGPHCQWQERLDRAAAADLERVEREAQPPRGGHETVLFLCLREQLLTCCMPQWVRWDST